MRPDFETRRGETRNERIICALGGNGHRANLSIFISMFNVCLD
jgi:hypothetical protein